MTRRDLLRRAGKASVTLAAAQLLAPLVLSGCSKPTGGSSTGVRRAHRERRARETIKVGILHSLTGTMAISEASLKDVELMAIDEINGAGGVLGKQIEAVVEDPESKFTDGFPDKARKLLLDDKVAAVFGCCTSVSRKNVLPVFEENNGLLFYPVQYEGNECSRYVVYIGATANQQILPALDWLLSEKGGSKKKFYLLGSDSIFPRTANLIVARYLESKGLKPVAEVYTPLGSQEYRKIIRDMRKADPDVIFSTITGDRNLDFYNELAAQGITAGKIPVVAVSVAENELRWLDPAKVKGHLAAWNYFQSINTDKNREFMRRFRALYGKHRVTDDRIEAAYITVYFWKQAVERAGSTAVDRVREAFKSGIEFDAPGGKVKLDPRTQHTYKRFYMGRINDDKQFDIIFSTDLLQPVPYPPIAFPGWGCDWTKGGVIRGEKVKIGM
jgi:urea transport system substrate-binding protein